MSTRVSFLNSSYRKFSIKDQLFFTRDFSLKNENMGVGTPGNDRSRCILSAKNETCDGKQKVFEKDGADGFCPENNDFESSRFKDQLDFTSKFLNMCHDRPPQFSRSIMSLLF